MNKNELFKQHVWEALYGKPESDRCHESEKKSPTVPEPVPAEIKRPAVSGRKVYGAALPPNWPQISSSLDAGQTDPPHASTCHSTSPRDSSSSSDSDEDECHKHRNRRRKRRRHNAETPQSSDQPSSSSRTLPAGRHTEQSCGNGQTQLTKNQKRKLKKKRQQKRRKEEERKADLADDATPHQTLQPGVFVYEGSARRDLEEEEKKRKEDLLKRLKDVTSFLDAVLDVYNRDMSLRGLKTWEGLLTSSVEAAVVESDQSLWEVELMSRAKSTALLGHHDLATQARLQLSQESSLPADLVHFISTMLEYWMTDVVKTM